MDSGGFMKLFEEICSYKSLLSAFDRVEENGGTHGTDNITVEEFSVNLEQRLLGLRKELLESTYLPSPLCKVSITKPNGKIRWLSIPTVKDRIAQTSAAMILSPLLDKEFEDCSFAYRKNMSVQKAIYRIIGYRDKGYHWIVDADIESFFDEVDHEILMREMCKYINDSNVIELIKKWLSVDVEYKGGKTRLIKGIPQGSPISPLLSNLYLDFFDEALIDEKIKHVRFADDFVILCKDKPEAENALELTEDVLGKLKLSLNYDKTRLTNFNRGFEYLGMEFIRSMVFRPIYKDKHETDEQPVEKFPDSPTPPAAKKHENIIARSEETKQFKNEIPHCSRNDFPGANTVMATAFREALEEYGQDDFDEIFNERPEIEPSGGGNPFLRTLYLLEQGSVLAKEHERFHVLKDGKIVREIPALKIDQIMVFGNIQITTQAMKFCLEEDIPIILLSSRGKYFGAVESFKKTRVVLHKKQFEMAGDKKALEIGKAIVRTKINNSKVVIQRYNRKRKHLSFSHDIEIMNILLNKIPQACSQEELMGIEGAASVRYFSSMRALINGEEWGFNKREKRPPPDPINSLLSFGYTMLFYNIYAVVRMHGLHPYIGFLHSIRDGHPSLVSDILEEFRAPIIDSTVMNLIVRGSLKKEDFIIAADNGAPCLLKNDTRKVFIRAFENKMNSTVIHTSTGYKVDYRRCIDLQIQALKKVIDGKLTGYEPMAIK